MRIIYTAVAKQLGVRPETVGRWRQLPAFQDALTAAEDPSYVDQDLNVVNLKWKGFDTLMNLLDDHNAAVRLRAAAEIFKLWGNRLPPYAGPDDVILTCMPLLYMAL